MMKTIDNDHRKRQLLKRFHMLLNRARIDEDGKREILASYGVEHSSEMDCAGLADVCSKLAVAMTPRASEADRWRKRVMASVFAYCQAMDYEAAGVTNFNRIPLERLRSLYNAFMQRVKDIEKVGRMADTPQGGGGFLYVMFPDGRTEIPGRINR